MDTAETQVQEDQHQTAVAAQPFSLEMDVEEHPEMTEQEETKDEKAENTKDNDDLVPTLPTKVGIILSYVHLQCEHVPLPKLAVEFYKFMCFFWPLLGSMWFDTQKMSLHFQWGNLVALFVVPVGSYSPRPAKAQGTERTREARKERGGKDISCRRRKGREERE